MVKLVSVNRFVTSCLGADRCHLPAGASGAADRWDVHSYEEGVDASPSDFVRGRSLWSLVRGSETSW